MGRAPDAVALVFGEKRLTYRELNEKANRPTHFLLGKGVKPNTLVGLCPERSPDPVADLLEILKAGAAYVPLDPAYPRERLAYMLEDADARVLVADPAWTATHLSLIREEGFLMRDKGRLAVVCPDTDGDKIVRQHRTNPAHEVNPKHPAYIHHPHLRLHWKTERR